MFFGKDDNLVDPKYQHTPRTGQPATAADFPAMSGSADNTQRPIAPPPTMDPRTVQHPFDAAVSPTSDTPYGQPATPDVEETVAIAPVTPSTPAEIDGPTMRFFAKERDNEIGETVPMPAVAANAAEQTDALAAVAPDDGHTSLNYKDLSGSPALVSGTHITQEVLHTHTIISGQMTAADAEPQQQVSASPLEALYEQLTHPRTSHLPATVRLDIGILRGMLENALNGEADVFRNYGLERLEKLTANMQHSGVHEQHPLLESVLALTPELIRTQVLTPHYYGAQPQQDVEQSRPTSSVPFGFGNDHVTNASHAGRIEDSRNAPPSSPQR